VGVVNIVCSSSILDNALYSIYMFLHAVCTDAMNNQYNAMQFGLFRDHPVCNLLRDRLFNKPAHITKHIHVHIQRSHANGWGG
jgi:hypothetical protein